LRGTLNVSKIINLETLSFADGTSQTTAGVAITTVWNSSGGNVYLNDSSASVGIGTTTPGEKLTVIGNVNVSKDVKAGNFTIEGSAGSLYQPVYGTDDDLVLYLPFSENLINISNTTYDRSPYGNDGTLVNMNYGNVSNGTGWSSGKYGYGMDFNGEGNYVDVGNDAS
ncbi:MAG: hypothetical protein QQN44_07495, partial [Nitrosopumilus sp.]